METTQAFRRLQAAKRQREGELGQIQAANLLRLLGATCVQRISTPWRIHRVKGRVVGATPVGQVAGDFTGLLPGGRGLLVEVKRRTDDALAWGDMEPHQHRHMVEHDAAGGASWVVWAEEAAIWAMWYTDMVAAGWSKGKPLHRLDAERLRITGPPYPSLT
jgi:hypothetical protein